MDALRTAAAALLLLLAAWPTPSLAFDPDSSCVACHGDRAMMAKLGAADFYLDPAAVDRELGMKGAPSCPDCHLGDPTAHDLESAHAGLLGPRLMVTDGTRIAQAATRREFGVGGLKMAGQGEAALVPDADPDLALEKELEEIKGIYWHDRDPATFAYAPQLAQQTCGKCHPSQTASYNRSNMGLLKFQRGNRSFADPLPGPHNCGAWFGDNFEGIAAETAVPFTASQSAALDRNCNQCHPGCNDCHYQPFRGEGRHLFSARPEPLSCYGGSRGVICHAGPMERRRGAGFLRGGYAFPKDLPQGAHARAGLSCLDCHPLGDHQSGHTASAEARGACARCHGEIVAAVKGSTHRRVDCASCHIREVGGYQFTAWGPGEFAGVESPYAKHAGYYGTRSLPTLVKGPEGLWLPFKPYPMAALNQKRSLKKTGVVFRAIPQRTIPGREGIGEPESFVVSRRADETHDALIVAGTREDLPRGNKAILWVQMEKLSHALGEARSCESCHASHAQTARSEFKYADRRHVAAPFTGSYTLVADGKGLRFNDLEHSEIRPAEGRSISDFAPFVLFPRGWNGVGGDLSIPFSDARYAREKGALDAFLAELEKARGAAATDPERLKALAPLRGIAHHNLAAAREELRRLGQP